MGRHDLIILLALITLLIAWVRAIKAYMSNNHQLSYDFKPAMRSVRGTVRRVVGDVTAWWDGARVSKAHRM